MYTTVQQSAIPNTSKLYPLIPLESPTSFTLACIDGTASSTGVVIAIQSLIDKFSGFGTRQEFYSVAQCK